MRSACCKIWINGGVVSGASMCTFYEYLQDPDLLPPKCRKQPENAGNYNSF